MGGSAYLINVIPDQEKLVRPFLENEKGKKKSFFSRLFGSGGADFPGLADLPCETLGNAMLNDFYGWVKKRIPNPTPATAAFMNDYLVPIRGSVYLRGERPDPARPEEFSSWYVQVTFSGCAGMGEVSSMLASHWVELWYRENFDRVNRSLLEPYHLRPAGAGAEPGGYGLFFEFGRWGMALYYPKGAEVEFFLEDREIMVNFELDAGTVESIHDEEELKKFHREALQIQANPPPGLERNKCQCQICL